jgi:heme exporter protein D
VSIVPAIALAAAWVVLLALMVVPAVRERRRLRQVNSAFRRNIRKWVNVGG